MIKWKKAAKDRWVSTDGKIEVFAERRRTHEGMFYAISHGGRRYSHQVWYSAVDTQTQRVVTESKGLKKLAAKLERMGY